MLKNKIIKILVILVIVIALVLTNSIITYADTIISRPDSFQPSVENSSTAKSVISKILSILIIIGIITFTLGIALVGFGAVLGSASEKAEYKQKLVGLIVAAIILVAGSSIAKIAIDFAEGIGVKGSSSHGMDQIM